MRLLRFKFIGGALELMDEHNYDYYGPHQLERFGNNIYVAIGGLKTNERDVTNKEDFESLILKLEATTLRKLKAYPATTKHVSLRHLAIDQTGQVYVAGQYQLAVDQSETLLFRLDNNALQPFNAPADLWPKLKGYLGSIRCINEKVIVTSPRAHWLGIFNSNTLTLEDQLFAHDICALANSPKGIVAGTGTGKLLIGDNMMNSHVIWDNHFQVARIK